MERIVQDIEWKSFLQQYYWGQVLCKYLQKRWDSRREVLYNHHTLTFNEFLKHWQLIKFYCNSGET